MISIKVSTRALEVTKLRIVAAVNRRYREIVYAMFEDMLLVSAQYSGEFTSNWQIMAGTGHSAPSFHPWPGKDSVAITQQPHRAGDGEAVTYARENMARKPFTYKDKVFFVNATPLEFTASTVTGPDGKTQAIRPENIIPGGVLIKSYLMARYGGKG